MTESVATLATPPIVGRFYQVPCFLHHYESRRAVRQTWVPIIGDLHEDSQIIGVAGQHWHYDWRFITQAQLRILWPMHAIGCDLESGCHQGRCMGLVQFVRGQSPTVREQRKKCRRRGPCFPVAYHDRHNNRLVTVNFLGALEANYAGCRLKGLVCPHRGLPLNGQPVRDGVVVCPGHGLAWNTETGEMVRRVPLPVAAQ